MWIAAICAAVAFVAYTAWKRSQLSPRIPVTAGASGAPEGGEGGGGLLDSISRTVDKLTGIFQGIGGRESPPAAAAPQLGPAAGVTWI